MDMEVDFKNYQLSQELRGHEDDVTTFLFPSQFFLSSIKPIPFNLIHQFLRFAVFVFAEMRE